MKKTVYLVLDQNGNRPFEFPFEKKKKANKATWKLNKEFPENNFTVKKVKVK